jgi:nicotinate-nucleotide pyrophosphorylase (carboxylating)
MSDTQHDLEAIITEDVSRALAEDVGGGDLTALLIPAEARGHARVVTREDAVIAGIEWFQRCFDELDPECELFWHVEDGKNIAAGVQICEIAGNARAMLTAERAALNFLQTLSAVATKTRMYVDEILGTQARIFDTRKTLPGLRRAQKYAVRVGGGNNHRTGLYDGILIKENHIVAAGGMRPALQAAFALVQHQAPRNTMIEIEVETLEQLREALDCGATLILLDNMSAAQMRDAVKIVAAAGRTGIELEASGGITLQSVRAIAETGVNRISVGALTKDVRALDLSMRFSMH